MEINITKIVAPYLQNITDQAGNHLIVVEAEDLKEIAEQIVVHFERKNTINHDMTMDEIFKKLDKLENQYKIGKLQLHELVRRVRLMQKPTRWQLRSSKSENKMI